MHPSIIAIIKVGQIVMYIEQRHYKNSHASNVVSMLKKIHHALFEYKTKIIHNCSLKDEA